MLFVVAIFASAFLLFMVQPMVGKHILPWFGGGPGVWTVCLTFYQTTLFLGYAYAHLLIRGTSLRWQPLITAVLFVGALLVLPVLPDASWQPEPGTEPLGRILATLLVNVGPPFFLLAANGPLIQAWSSQAFPSRSPYPLFAASNLGSLLALLCFPLLIEPTTPLSRASSLWSVLFAGCGVLVVTCAGWAARTSVGVVTEARAGAHEGEEPSAGAVLLWIGLSAVAVVLLLGVTNELCLDVASIPFLWVLPLSIYLVTLIICFGWDRAYQRGVIAGLAAVTTMILIGIWLSSASLGFWVAATSILAKIVVYAVALFAWCMLAHGELHRLRPAPTRLTTYYLCISGGGALGGLFVGIAAPRIFSDYYELPLGVVAVWVLFLAACWRDPTGPLGSPGRRLVALAAAVGLALVTNLAVRPEHEGLLFQERSFFGVSTVSELSSDHPPRYQREFSSGTTLHGVQLVRPAPRMPTAYFGSDTAIGMVMSTRPDGAASVVGVAGLGIGTLAAYGRPGDRFRFYEIDPSVIRIARDDGWFTFLGDSAAEVEVVAGDARLELDRELRDRQPLEADVLVLDAFSSDAVPVHLLTAEAFEVYAQHITPGGVIALNVSTNYLDLVPPVFRLAENAGFDAVAIVNEDHGVSFYSRWIVMSRDASYLSALARRACANRKASTRVWFPDPHALGDVPLWTDDHSDLFRVLRPRGEFDDPGPGEDVCSEMR